MSFFGKKYKKVSIDNILEILDALKIGEKTRALLGQTEAQSTYLKNDDGTIQYQVAVGDKIVFDQKIPLDKEEDFTNPDGVKSKVTFTLNGDVLKSVMKVEDGKVINLVRTFDGDSMKMEIEVEGLDLKGVVTYKAV